MAGGRGRRRRQAAKSYEDQDKTRWANAIAIAIRLPPTGNDHDSGSKQPNSSLQKSEVAAAAAVLELAGFESATRTIFARIRRRPMVGCGDHHRDGDDQSIKTTENKDGIPPSSTIGCCWRVEDLVGAVVNEISLREDATHEANNDDGGNRNNVQPKQHPPLVESSESLLELGSVWVLDPASSDRPQNKPKWKRILKDEDDGQAIQIDGNRNRNGNFSCLWFDDTMTLRVHSRPSRYPMARKFRMALQQQKIDGDDNLSGSSSSGGSSIHGGIVYEMAIEDTTTEQTKKKKNTTTLAFAVLNKPLGMPSHSTVDNAVENLLYQYQRHRRLGYATLPQRLDTETSGLLLVATRPPFATYFSKLLEQKTTTNASSTSCTTNPGSSPLSLQLLAPSNQPSIQKRYRCLVVLPKGASKETWDSIQKKYITPGTIVEHYVDANSGAPKIFVDASEFHKTGGPVTTTTTNSKESSHSFDSIQKWQLCKLRILTMTMTMTIPKLSRESSFDRGEESENTPDNLVCSELEIELLTGRTHQIRGQLAALGCPIFGDPLYGNGNGNGNGNALAEDNNPTMPRTPKPRDWMDRSALRMALQCCELAFPVDVSVGRKCDCECDAPLPSVRRNWGNASDSNRNGTVAFDATTEGKEIVASEDDPKSDGPIFVAPDDCPRQLGFQLDSAWWRDE